MAIRTTTRPSAPSAMSEAILGVAWKSDTVSTNTERLPKTIGIAVMPWGTEVEAVRGAIRRSSRGHAARPMSQMPNPGRVEERALDVGARGDLVEVDDVADDEDPTPSIEQEGRAVRR